MNKNQQCQSSKEKFKVKDCVLENGKEGFASEFEGVGFSMDSLHFKPKATKINQLFVINAWRDVFFYWPCHFLMHNEK